MIKSMTGFGRAKLEKEAREYIVEIKTVNHKYNDIAIKMPKTISYLEENIKKLISKEIHRGKVEVCISFINNSTEGKNIKINTEIAKLYIQELKQLAKETGIAENINLMEITKLPDVLNIQNETEDKTIEDELTIAVNQAIEALLTMRKNEGEKIEIDLRKRIEILSEKIDQISSLSTGLVEEYVVKLEARIKELLNTDVIDQNRLAQEIVIYSDKCSIEEEITRLKSHFVQFNNFLNQDTPVGKKLDFIVQEMNRETNTIGAKANKLEITNLVVDMKTEIENIREQIQNIE